MRKNINYIIPLIVIIILGFTACNDTYEFHEKYIQDGETIYATKVDSLVVLGGNKRVKIQGYISNAFNVTEITVYWNKGENSQSFAYEKSDEDIDKVELIVDNLEEKTYEFEVVSTDSDGNTSLKVVTFGTSYGENFKSNLEPRGINSISIGADNNAKVYLKPAFEVTKATEIKFTNLSGEEIVNTILAEISETTLEQIDIMAPVMYRTFYVPTAPDENGNETSIDEFDSSWETYVIPTTFDSIFDSFTFEPISGGVIANWENSDNVEMKFTFLKIVDNNPISSEITSSQSTDSYSIEGMKGSTQDIEITLTDVYGNSKSKSFEVTPMGSVGKGAWTIVDFSSEEPAEANWGPPIQGSAAAAIDGELDTFWHTAWANSAPDYPHYFTFDMGAEKDIAGFEVFTRSGDGRGATVHEFWVSSDNVTFTKVATLNESIDLNTGSYVDADANTTGRYVKYLAVTGPNNFTFLGEINVIERLDNLNWSIVDFSSEEPAEANWGPPIQGRAAATIDGDYNTFWHSAWELSAPDYPHYFTIDLGEERSMTSFEIFRRNGAGGGATVHEFWVSNDNVSFTKVATLNAALTTDEGFSTDAAANTKGRYVKYLATEGPNNFTYLSEIQIYGAIE